MAGSSTSDAAQAVTIVSPAKGWLIPLDQVPDPAFASGALGSGVGLELLDGFISAPCNGKVAAIARAQHAITIETPDGFQILIHCGIDTVALDGAPFTVIVAEGAKVAAGEPLMQVDIESVVRAGKSLATPIVLVEPTGHALAIADLTGRLCEPGDPLFSVEANATDVGVIEDEAEFTAAREVALDLPHGLHARPSAAIATEAKNWRGPIAIAVGHHRADARSPTALMKLGATRGTTLRVEAGGSDSQAAVAAITALIEAGAGDELAQTSHASGDDHEVATFASRRRAQPDLPKNTIAGVSAAPGQALGTAYFLHRARLQITEKAQGVPFERERLDAALKELRRRLDDGDHDTTVGIGAAHRAILDDPAIAQAVDQRITSGSSAACAWQEIMEQEATSLRALPDPRLAERADDFADLEQQLLRILCGKDAEVTAPAGSIVVAHDLYPSDLAPLAQAGIAGIATVRGGATSHLAILAASANIPMAAACGEYLCDVEEGEYVFLDGDAGTLRHSLSAPDRETLAMSIERQAAAYAEAREQANEDTFLASGERIEVFANLGRASEAEEAVALGAEGVGLLRTEFLFLDRSSPPTEDEQVEAYRAIIERLEEKPVIIRTLDIGADKPARYLRLDKEDNPALGLRGIRVGLQFPALLKDQLRAILQAAGDRTAHVMAPMVSSLEEVVELHCILDEARTEIGHKADVRIGAMIETPASALIASTLAAHLDFLSVGTNDLTQYTLAADRTNPDLAAMQDPMHPAVLRLISLAGEACRHTECDLGVCGSAASDPLAAAVLAGLGVTELSASAGRIPELKQYLRKRTLNQCREAASAALVAEGPAEARAVAEQVLAQGSEG